jgi:GntR family transcriptional regulator
MALPMLNPQSPVPLYHQLAEILLAGIRSGDYPPGSRIPPEQALSAAYGIGRPTVRQALDLLVRKRILERRRGSGTYVRAREDEIDLFSLAGTSAAFQKKGVSVSTRMLRKASLSTVEDDPDNPFSGHKAYCLSRLTAVDDTPVLIENFFLHPLLFSGMESMDLEGQSLSRIVDERYHMRPSGGKQTFRIGYLEGENARHLAVSAAMPVLVVKRILSFSQAENAIYAELYCRTDRFVFSQAIGGMTND